MNPDLACQLRVRTNASGSIYLGSGYPISRDRILTAGHNVEDWKSIELAFGEKLTELTTAEPVTVQWSGLEDEELDHPVDAAILKCKLPEHLQPVNRLQSGRIHGTIPWNGAGFSEFSETRHGQDPVFPPMDRLSGEISLITEETRSLPITCKQGPKPQKGRKDRPWGGASGTVIFSSDAPYSLLGVVTHQASGSEEPEVIVVPLPFLLGIPKFCAAAFGEEAAARRQTQLDEVSDTIERLLAKITGNEARSTLLGCLRGITNWNVTQFDVAAMTDAFVRGSRLNELVAALMKADLKPSLDGHSPTLYELASVVLPLRFRQHEVTALHERLGNNQQQWLIESAASSMTLIEALLAGFDGSTTDFDPSCVAAKVGKARPRDLIGASGRDLRRADVPPVGPEASEENKRNCVKHLHSVLELSPDDDGYGPDSEPIGRLVMELRSELDILRDSGRTVYGIVELSGERIERQWQVNMYNSVSELLNPKTGPPRIIFVERIGQPDDNDPQLQEETDIDFRFCRLLMRASVNRPSTK